MRIYSCTHSYVRAVTWLAPEEVVMTSRRWLPSSVARRSNTSLLCTSITDTSTVRLSAGFSEMSLRHTHLLHFSSVNTSGQMPLNLPKELSGGLGDDSLLRLLLRPCEDFQWLASYHGVSFPTSCLPICHDTHIVTERQGKNRQILLYPVFYTLMTAFSLWIQEIHNRGLSGTVGVWYSPIQ